MIENLQGIPASAGSALAPAFILKAEPALVDRVPGTTEEELALLQASLPKAAQQIETLAEKVRKEVGENEAAIFSAHVAFANDPFLLDYASDQISDGHSAEEGVSLAFAMFKGLLLESGDEYNMARAADLDDVCTRVIKVIQGIDDEAAIPTVRSIIIAEELTPSQTAMLPQKLMAGLVTEKGSATSHAAILARASGIPAIVGATGITSVEAGTVVGMNGSTGAVVLNPSEAEVEEINLRIQRENNRKTMLEELVNLPGQTKDGRSVELAANIGGPDGLPIAAAHGAQGCGLVRSELVFQNRTTAPSAREQADFYAKALAQFPGHKVVVRTMDVGADKPLPFVVRAPEENPALGVRGIRLSLREPELFDAQLRGLLMAHQETHATGKSAKLCIMFPLVSTVPEFVAAKKRVHELAEEMDVDINAIEIGMMIEVPIAALIADDLAKEADFFSIGTNDLVQYTFAADRLDSGLAEMATYLHPGLIRLIRDVIAKARDNDVWVGICGESASDPIMSVIATGLGIRELSMTSTAIGEVKDLLRHLDMADCVKAAEFACQAHSAEEVKEGVAQIVREAKGRLHE